MKDLIIYCDGGFGNRYGTLLGGLFIARLHNLRPIINWRETSQCRASFNDIFENEQQFSIINSPLEEFNEYVLIMHDNFIKGKAFYSANAFSTFWSLGKITIDEDKLLYNNNWLPRCMNESEFLSVGNSLNFKKDIQNSADDFAKETLINVNVTGVHLRATDFNVSVPNFSREFVIIMENPDTRYFVLSDDKTIENKFNQFENVVVRKKVFYVEKVNETSTWCNNIERSRESVIESLIDLLILSKTKILTNSTSTFLKTSLILQKINGQKQIGL